MISEGGAVRLGLKSDAEPALAVRLMGKTVRGHRVGKDEKGGFVAARFVQALQQQVKFVIEHRLQALAADVPVRWPVNRVADRHVVGGHGLGHRAGRAADVEKPAGHFLAGADFGERAVFGGVEIDLKRLLRRCSFLVQSSSGFHPFAPQNTQKSRRVHSSCFRRGLSWWRGLTSRRLLPSGAITPTGCSLDNIPAFDFPHRENVLYSFACIGRRIYMSKKSSGC